jgi:outer membrane receptor protein involved in Fe transport
MSWGAMNKTSGIWVRLSWLAVACAGVLGAADDVQKLAPLTVTATRSPQAAEEVPLALTRIEGGLIARAVAVDEALAEAPAFGLFRRTSSVIANPTAQGVSLRGIGPSGASRSLVLLDGVPLNDPFGGWVAWSAVPRLSLGEAQIVPGGGSSVWGSAALSGVIALERAPLESRRIEAGAELGAFETVRGEMSATVPVGKGFVRVEAETFSTDGFFALKPSDRGAVDRRLDSEHQTVQATWRQPVGAAVVATTTVRYFEEERGNGTVLQNNTSEAGFASLALAGTPRDGLVWNAVAYGQRQEFSSFFTAVSADRQSETQSNDQFAVPAEAAGTAASVTWQTEAARTTVGGDARWVEGETQEDFLLQAGQFTRRRFAGGEQLFAGVFAHHDRRLGEQWRASLDVRLDHWQNDDGHLREVDRATSAVVTNNVFADRRGGQFSPRAGLVWQPSKQWRLRTAAYRAFRVPTLNEYYRPFRVGTANTLANAALDVETLTGAELGGEFSAGPVRLEATGFISELRDAVGNVTLSSTPSLITRQRQNLDEVRVRGLELGARWQAHRVLELRANYLWSEAEVTAARAQPSLVGKRLAQVPVHKFTLGATWAAPGGVNVRTLLRGTSQQYEDDENRLSLRAATTVDFQVERALGRRALVFAAVENVFNEKVVTSRSTVGLLTYDAPRWVRGGVRWTW